jgi:hypothetical protein
MLLHEHDSCMSIENGGRVRPGLLTSRDAGLGFFDEAIEKRLAQEHSQINSRHCKHLSCSLGWGIQGHRFYEDLLLANRRRCDGALWWSLLASCYLLVLVLVVAFLPIFFVIVLRYRLFDFVHTDCTCVRQNGIATVW